MEHFGNIKVIMNHDDFNGNTVEVTAVNEASDKCYHERRGMVPLSEVPSLIEKTVDKLAREYTNNVTVDVTTPDIGTSALQEELHRLAKIGVKVDVHYV